MVWSHEVFYAVVFRTDLVYQWNQSLCRYSRESETNASLILHRVYSDVYVFYDVVDVPRKINAIGRKSCLLFQYKFGMLSNYLF